ncbi:MAG: hypothetical protein OP8BY_1299 [Candidatus Saccharicenans subterraneus]|uniref:DNA repair photolyase n=1 Tax=Candidatus Saccharicenans subterraneus TaxID=2508984 RepID=A0A3E2BPX3_9BACT|nr:MAG: hypothetical protein OP8BY_1299 [Candidatus Saccharicenans subterraneum]
MIRKRVISASRRTDLVAYYPDWLASCLRKRRATFFHHGRRSEITVDLNPEEVHTLVLWSKNFKPLLENRHGLKELLADYDQVYLHFTITGLGGSFIERMAPSPDAALEQIPGLLKVVGRPERISIRFDPVVFWRDGGQLKTNLDFFPALAREMSRLGIKTIRFSFTQWYKKAVARARKVGLDFYDPGPQEKKEAVKRMVEVAAEYGLELWSCSQAEIARLPGVKASACIDGALLTRLHPAGEPASTVKDRTQREDCLCTDSIDIGSYTQSCPAACVYCYANPRLGTF